MLEQESLILSRYLIEESDYKLKILDLDEE
jgi:hypothetical protein